MTDSLRSLRAFVPILVILVVTPSASPGQVRFGRPGSRALPPHDAAIADIAHGDVDGDGDVDLLIAGPVTELWVQQAAGRFTRSPAVPSRAADAVTLGDFDGDGDLDALVADHLWANDGGGGYTEIGPALPPGSPPSPSVTGDFDGDGDLDVFRQDLFLNDGTGHFTPSAATAPGPPLLPVEAAAAADVDGDGDLDLLLTFRATFTPCGGWGPCTVANAHQPRLWLNDGAGTFAEATGQLPQQAVFGLEISLGDVDGDGDLDAVLADGHEASTATPGSDRLWLNDGLGLFADASGQLPPNVGFTTSVELIDMDQDGDLDLLRASSENQGSQPIWLNDGTGAFTATAASIPAAGPLRRHLVAADLDQDGDVDVLAADARIRNGAPGWLNANISPVLARPELWLSDGAGTWTPVSHRDASSGVAGAGALADVDGDGDIDALFGDRLRRNRGDGQFQDDATAVPTVPSPAFALALGDLDGDGDPDAVVGRTGQTELWINQGTGNFSDATFILPVDSGTTSSISLSDVDGDGDLDIVLGKYFGQNRLWLNLGAYTFQDATLLLPQAGDATRGLAAGDVDGDGDLDLMVANDEFWTSQLHLNDGTGTFTAAVGQIPSGEALAARFGDLDGDGDLDLVLGGGTRTTNAGGFNLGWYAFAGQSCVWSNDGTGTFTVSATPLPIAPVGRAVAIADVDADGDSDLLFAGPRQGGPDWNEQTVSLALNDGTGAFLDGSSNLAPIPLQPFGFAVGDIDEDGDPDILSSGWIQRNLLRHVARPTVPRLGYPLTLDVYGTPNAAYLLAASPNTGRLVIPTGGRLLLDLPSTVLVASGHLDQQGEASFTLPVPNDPALAGLTVYWQAAVAGPAPTTNRETTTLTTL